MPASTPSPSSPPTTPTSSSTPPPPPAAELPKAYKPAEVEPAISARWDQSGAFHADPAKVLSGERQPFCILIPPPNVTGALHLGHALNNTIQDILTRAHRMMGYEALWMPGTDHAGIATQAVVERRLKREQGKSRKDFTRDQFVALVQEWKDEYEKRITNQLKAMGASCDFARQRFTMDDICARAVREAFFRLFRDGLIYRGKRLVNWDPALQTAVSDDECYDEEIDAGFYYLRYPLVHWGNRDEATKGRSHGGKDETRDPMPITWDELAVRGYPHARQHPPEQQAWITVATTRPETYLGDTAVAVNPHDPRAKALRGLWVELPLVGRIIPIVEDDYVVLPAALARTEEEKNDPKAAFATGFLKVTPAHDQNDNELYTRHKETIDRNSAGTGLINVMGPDGAISDKHGWTDLGREAHLFVGLSREDARKKVLAEFKVRTIDNSGYSLLEDIKPYRHTVKHSDRSKAIIEPWLSDQWFMKVTDARMARSANEALVGEQRSGASAGTEGQRDKGTEGGETDDQHLRFHPARYAKMFEQWHDNIRDWCISRQLWWGHRIPVWSHTSLDAKAFASIAHFDGDPDVSGFEKYTDWNVRRTFAKSDAEVLGTPPGTESFNVCVRPGRPDIEQALQAAGFTQDPDVLDTWFSSALWPLSTLGWPEPSQSAQTKGLLEAFNPTSVLSTAREIITLWVSRMVMMNRYFTGAGSGHGNTPFHDVFIHAVVQDGDGKRMSKSAGNGVDPLDIINSHGADALRFTLCQMTTQTQDVRMPVETVCPHCQHVFSLDSKHQITPGTKGIADAKCPECKKEMVTPLGVGTGQLKPTADKPAATNTSRKFDAGRNFCNKLWNATRFAMGILGSGKDGVPGSEFRVPREDSSAARGTRIAEPSSLSLIDRWMLSRLRRSVEDVNAALNEYQFASYAQSLYDLLWRDFCDWYLETIKPTAAGDPAQRAVLAHSLETIVRLLHPVTPFVTESIWERLKHVQTAPVAGIELEASRVNGLLATAGWPKLAASLRDESAERDFARVQALVTLIREVRAQHNVAPKRRITLHAPKPLLDELRSSGGLPYVESLAGLEAATDSPAAPDAPSVSLRVESYDLTLSNLTDRVDVGTEKERLSKELADKSKAAGIISKRLENAGYVAKAPPKLVEESKAQLATLEAEIAGLSKQLETMR